MKKSLFVLGIIFLLSGLFLIMAQPLIKEGYLCSTGMTEVKFKDPPHNKIKAMAYLIGVGAEEGKWYLLPAGIFGLAGENVRVGILNVEVPNSTLGRGFDRYDFDYIYIWDIKNKKYILVMDHGEYVESPEAIDFLQRVNNDLELSNYYKHSTVWAYVKGYKIGCFFINAEKYGSDLFNLKINDIKLVKGWNFLVLPDTIGTYPGKTWPTFDDIKGNCSIVKFASWSPDYGKWGVYDFGLIANDYTNNPGEPMLFKVAEDCSLGFEEEVPTPPIFPTGEAIKKVR